MNHNREANMAIDIITELRDEIDAKIDKIDEKNNEIKQYEEKIETLETIIIDLKEQFLKHFDFTI